LSTKKNDRKDRDTRIMGNLNNIMENNLL